MITYYKSRFLSPPVIYVQQDDDWKSYGPGGRIQKNIGPLPQYILQNADEVPYDEVEDLIHGYTDEAARAEAERLSPPPLWGIGGWIILPIIGLFISCIGSIYFLFRADLPLLRSWDALTSPASSSYHPLFGPYIGFVTFVNSAVFVVAIFLLVLIFKRKRVLPTIIIYVYAAFLFFMLADFVAGATFIYQFMAERGFADEASGLVAESMASVILRGLIICGIWIPYFLYSKRVRNTFDQPWNSRRAARPHTEARRAILAALAAEATAEDAGLAEPPAGEAQTPLDTQVRPRILLIPLVAIMVIILGVVIGLAVWRFADATQVANSVTNTVDANGNELKHYSNTTGGFSFDYPADWALNSGRAPAGLPGFQVNVRDPQGAMIDNEPVDGVLIVAYDSSAGQALPGLSELHATIKTNVEAGASAQGWEIVSDVTDVTNNGTPGVTVTCKVPISGQRVTASMYWLIGPDRLYYVFVTLTEDPADDSKPRLEAIVNSLHIQQ